jgi:phosphoribosylformylglycinamidine synthase
MVGLIEDINEKMTLDFKGDYDFIYVLGVINDDINCSEYLHKLCGVEFSPAPHFDLDAEFTLHGKVKQLINAKLVLSAHDISEGGLFTTLCESAFNREVGFSIRTKDGLRKDAFLFGEGQNRVLVSVSAGNLEKFRTMVGDFPHEQIGVVTSGEIMVDGDFWGTIDWWQHKYDTSIEKYLAKEEAGAALSSI